MPDETSDRSLDPASAVNDPAKPMRADEQVPDKEEDPKAPYSPIEGEDYYLEGAMMVFTERFLLRRGFCCESGCRHCPYGFSKDKGAS